jgi:hypothetical protein
VGSRGPRILYGGPRAEADRGRVAGHSFAGNGTAACLGHPTDSYGRYFSLFKLGYSLLKKIGVFLDLFYVMID